MQHTDGPWRYSGEKDGFILAGDSTTIAQTFNRRDEDFENARVNGPLLAAAPELLEACKHGLQTLEVAVRSGLRGFSKYETEEIVANHSALKAMREAIAKATTVPVVRNSKAGSKR